MTTFYRVCATKLKHFDWWGVLVGWVAGIWTAVLSITLMTLLAFVGVAQAAELSKAAEFPVVTEAPRPLRPGELPTVGGITLDRGVDVPGLKFNPEIPTYTSVPIWDVPPEACQSKTYEWTEGAFKCIGRVIQESGIPLLEPGLRGAVMESQRDYHLSAQKMYRLKAAVYLTPQWLNFKNAEELMKRGSEAMEKLQDMARAICGTGNTKYSGSMVACVKTETAGGMISKALSRREKK